MGVSVEDLVKLATQKMDVIEPAKKTLNEIG